MAVMGKDMYHNVKPVTGVHSVAIGTTGTGKTTPAIDIAGYGAITFIVDYGAVTATSAVFTALLTESDTTGGTFTSVADEDMIPKTAGEAAVGLAAAVRADGTTKNVTKLADYVGNKRYVKLKVSSTATAGTPVAIMALLQNPRHAPVV